MFFCLHDMQKTHIRGLSQKFVDFIHNSNNFLVRDKIITLLITFILSECYGKKSKRCAF